MSFNFLSSAYTPILSLPTRHISLTRLRPRASTPPLEIVITRTTSKTDQAGMGTNYSFRRNPDPAAAFDFVTHMFQWTQLAKPARDAPFFSYRGEWTLAYDKYNAAIKVVMASLGFQSVLSQFSSHSIRIGGASILAAAGFSDCVIKKMGNWKSLAFLRYIRLSTETFDKCLAALSDPSILSTDSVARMLPGLHSRPTSHFQLPPTPPHHLHR